MNGQSSCCTHIKVSISSSIADVGVNEDMYGDAFEPLAVAFLAPVGERQLSTSRAEGQGNNQPVETARPP